jgi:hypothetical protein
MGIEKVASGIICTAKALKTRSSEAWALSPPEAEGEAAYAPEYFKTYSRYFKRLGYF